MWNQMNSSLNSNAFWFFLSLLLIGGFFMHHLLLPENVLIQARAKEIYIDEKARDLCQNWYYESESIEEME